MAVICNGDEGWTDATDPGPANFAMAHWIEQDAEPAEVGGMHWPNATDGHSVLELTLIVRRRNNRSVDCQDIEPGTILAAVVAKLDNVPLPKLVQHLGQLVMIAPPSLAYRIQKGIPDFSRNMEWLTSLNFLESICHG